MRGCLRLNMVRLPLVLALFVAGSGSVFGQEPGPGNHVDPDAHFGQGEVQQASVVVDAETLFVVRGTTAYPAEQRAGEIADRIVALADRPAFATASLRIEERAGYLDIMAEGQRVMSVYEADAQIERLGRQYLAAAYVTRIAAAIDQYRQAREPKRLTHNLLFAAASTLVLLGVAWFSRRLLARVRAALDRHFRPRVPDFRVSGFQVVEGGQLWRVILLLVTVMWVVAMLAALDAYLSFVLGLFPWTRGLGKGLFALVVQPLQTLALGLVGILPNLVFLTVLGLVIWWMLRLVRLFFAGVASGTVTLTEFYPEWAWPTYRLVRFFLLGLALIVAYPQIPGSDSLAFKGLSLLLGLLVSFGSSAFIGNLIAGYSVTYRRAFRVGDRVKIGEHVGDVEAIRMQATHLRTPKGEEVIVPNSLIVSTDVLNYSSRARDAGLVLHTTVGIGYEVPWRQVEAMLVEAAGRTVGLLREPAPFVLETNLGDFCVTYEINAHCSTPQLMPALYAGLHRNILDVFNEYGVQIMTPAYEGDPPEAKNRATGPLVCDAGGDAPGRPGDS